MMREEIAMVIDTQGNVVELDPRTALARARVRRAGYIDQRLEDLYVLLRSSDLSGHRRAVAAAEVEELEIELCRLAGGPGRPKLEVVK